MYKLERTQNLASECSGAGIGCLELMVLSKSLSPCESHFSHLKIENVTINDLRCYFKLQNSVFL